MRGKGPCGSFVGHGHSTRSSDQIGYKRLAQASGTSRSSSSSQMRALPSEGARQSPRGESEPPAATFGPFGMAERLNWAEAEEALEEYPQPGADLAQRVGAAPFLRESPAASRPRAASPQACSARNAILEGRKP